MPIDEQDLMQLIGNVVHDLKAPLSSMKTLIDGIAEVGELNDKQRYFADRARAKLMIMTHMMNTVMEMAWVDAAHPLNLAPVSLRALVAHNLVLVEDAAASRKIELRLQIPEEFVTIDADERMINQIVLNLISNAVKYNTDGGYVNIQATETPDRVQFIVEDCGKGIPLEDQPRIFERFFRAKSVGKVEGTGLGLAIVKTAVDRHAGEITFTSEPGVGTKFVVTLPRRQSIIDEPRARSTGEMYRAGEGINTITDSDHGSEPIDAVDDSIQESQDESDEIADSHAEAGRELQSGV